MGKEDYIKMLIKESGKSIKKFSDDIDVPYSTLLTILNNGIDGASFGNITRICNGLSISLDNLNNDSKKYMENKFYISDQEKTFILNYRNKKDIRNAINILLDIKI